MQYLFPVYIACLRGDSKGVSLWHTDFRRKSSVLHFPRSSTPNLCTHLPNPPQPHKLNQTGSRLAGGLFSFVQQLVKAHADERNKALSEQLGRDVYHYHLHVMYIPVVDAEIRWTKRCKDPALVGKVKAVIKQVSNSKKWRSEMITGEDGKRRLSYSYSALQDRFHAHILAAGYDDIERGQKGSNAEHLDTLEFKIKRDNERSAELAQKVQAKQQQVSGLDKKLAVRKNVDSAYHDIDGMAKRSRSGKVILEPEDWETVSSMAKEGVIAKVNASALGKQLESTTQSLAKEKAAYKGLYERTLPYLEAVKIAPDQVGAALDAILRQHREQVHRKQQRGRSAVR